MRLERMMQMESEMSRVVTRVLKTGLRSRFLFWRISKVIRLPAICNFKSNLLLIHLN